MTARFQTFLLFISIVCGMSSASAAIIPVKEEVIAETHASVAAIDHDETQALQAWLNAGHSPLTKINNKLHERLIDRAAAHASMHVFELLLKAIHAEHADAELKDSRGTPILISLSTLAAPGRALTPKYEQMVALVIIVAPSLVQSQDHAYIGDGRSALQQAAAVGNLKIMQMLIAAGANVNAKNQTGETALHFAARFGHLDAVKYLVSSGALINEQSKFTHTTPLMAAAESGDETIIRYLVLSGAEKDARDIFGKTAPERFREYKVVSSSSSKRK